MPTWPTTTVSTTHLDAGTDRPSLARADLKIMADVVNELVNYGAPSSTPSVALILATGTGTQTLPYTLVLTEQLDTTGFISISSNQFSLTSGDYLIEVSGRAIDTNTGNAITIYFYNVTDSSNILSNIGGGVTAGNYYYVRTFNLAATKTVEFQVGTSGTVSISATVYVKLSKF